MKIKKLPVAAFHSWQFGHKQYLKHVQIDP
jgi:hypothetical protein